jgi:hypothetical protein
MLCGPSIVRERIPEMTNYDEELAGLPVAVDAAVKALDECELRHIRSVTMSQPLYAVASGGAAPAAVLAAELHRNHRDSAAESMSPLRLVERLPKLAPGVVMLFSARGKHPDTSFATKAALQAGHSVILLTQRSVNEIDRVYLSPSVLVVTLPSPHGSDGFLATQSVAIMATVMLSIYGTEIIPPAADFIKTPQRMHLRSRLLVVADNIGSAAAADIEARFHELGLADVQITDLRSLAHGRHVGLERHRERTSVLFLTSPKSIDLTARTIGVLPEGLDVIQLTTQQTGELGALDLLLQVMHLPVIPASEQRVEPARPKVPLFGRKLYHLNFKRSLAPYFPSPVARKLRSAGLTNSSVALDHYQTAFHTWRETVASANFKGLVLDYDGTCVGTKERLDLPLAQVQSALLQKLDEGMLIGFASGRGSSLRESLRSWIPESYWPQVRLGLHNGSEDLALGDALAGTDDFESWVHQITERLDGYISSQILSVRTNAVQVSFESTVMGVASIRALVQSAVARKPQLGVHVQSSGHSVDVVGAHVGKDVFLESFQNRVAGDVLAVGDQGDINGNDFAMLAATKFSVSVDACSPDPTRCWNIAPAELKGPVGLLSVLTSIKTVRGRTKLIVPTTDGS